MSEDDPGHEQVSRAQLLPQTRMDNDAGHNLRGAVQHVQRGVHPYTLAHLIGGEADGERVVRVDVHLREADSNGVGLAPRGVRKKRSFIE